MFVKLLIPDARKRDPWSADGLQDDHNPGSVGVTRTMGLSRQMRMRQVTKERVLVLRGARMQ